MSAARALAGLAAISVVATANPGARADAPTPARAARWPRASGCSPTRSTPAR
jgi:hypothetical protein